MPLARWLMQAAALVLVALLASCSQTADRRAGLAAKTTSQEACCRNPERYPHFAIKLLEPAAPLVGRTIALVKWRRGHLAAYPDMQARITADLRPLDVLMVGHEGLLTNRAIPGLFTHGVAYLGTEAQLRRLGMWDDPAVRPFQAQIRQGKTLIEADRKGVHLATPSSVLETDRVVVMRPACAATPRRNDLLRGYFAHLGAKFDFHFDSRDNKRLYCVELVNHIMSALHLPTRDVYGRPTIIPDEVVMQAAKGKSRLAFLRYVRANRTTADMLGRKELAADITEAWQ